jgi:hypothetical protein
VEYNGFCKQGYECVVPSVFEPVCGSDMRTYTNKDAVDCYNADPDTGTGKLQFSDILSPALIASCTDYKVGSFVFTRLMLTTTNFQNEVT